jgi:hypothetical protein
VRILALIGFLAIVGAIAAGYYFFAGYYDVGAAAQPPAVVDWALANVRAASIARHATDQPPPALDDPATIQSGPGVHWEKFSEGMRPWPADLKDIATQRSAAEIFWVVKNGVGMTGMPGFGSEGVPDQEIWTIAAFVKKLPLVSEGDYKGWIAAK